jgi:hypothetical protein
VAVLEAQGTGLVRGTDGRSWSGVIWGPTGGVSIGGGIGGRALMLCYHLAVAYGCCGLQVSGGVDKSICNWGVRSSSEMDFLRIKARSILEWDPYLYNVDQTLQILYVPNCSE